MGFSEISVLRWHGDAPPDKLELERRLRAEHLNAYNWSNGPHDTYAAHSHSYAKVIYVLSGSITFGLPAFGQQIRLGTGDRLDLPAGIVHDAVVGPQGVACLEAHR